MFVHDLQQAFTTTTGAANGGYKSAQKTGRPQSNKGLKRKEREERPEDQLVGKNDSQLAHITGLHAGKALESLNDLDEDT